MANERITLTHIFIDHSNMWGGARAALQVKDPHLDERGARINVRALSRS